MTDLTGLQACATHKMKQELNTTPPQPFDLPTAILDLKERIYLWNSVDGSDHTEFNLLVDKLNALMK